MSDMDIDDLKQKLAEAFQNRYLLGLIGIVIVAAFLRFKYGFFSGLWVDEASMARMAVDVSQHPLQYMTEWRGELTKRPPVFIYLMAISNIIFGSILGTDTAIRLVNPFMGVLTVVGSYFVGREMYSKKLGLIAAALLTVNPLAWHLSTRVLLETTLATMFVFTIGTFYYALEDRDYSRYALWATGPLVALTLLTKQPAYTLGLILPIYFLYRNREEFNDYLMTDKDFNDSRLYSLLTDRNYYIAGGLGVMTLIPWMVRNMSVCNFPLCGVLKALNFASKDVTRATASVQSPYYFILALGTILTLPVAIFLGVRIFQCLSKEFNINPDNLVKKGVMFLVLNVAAFFIAPRFSPMMLLTSTAIFANNDADKLLWLWAGIGIGFMSVPEIKVPRYIVFTIPALVLLSSKGIYNLSGWIAGNIPVGTDKFDIDAMKISMIILIPLVATSAIQGLGMVSNPGFAGLNPAGKWLADNMQDEERFASTSPQMKYFARPHIDVASAGRLPQNSTEFQEFALEENISYLVVDTYERTQPEWMQVGIAPYMLPQQTIQQLRQGTLSAQDAIQRFKTAPSYLVPVQSFGETRVPLTQSNQQPEVIIYQFNRSATQ